MVEMSKEEKEKLRYLADKLKYGDNAKHPFLKMEGKKVYVTGAIPGMSKDEVKRLLVSQLGIQYASGMIRSLDLLVTGVNPGPEKLKKAKEWKIQVMSWDNFKHHYLR